MILRTRQYKYYGNSSNAMEYEIEFCVGCYLDAAIKITKGLLQTNTHTEDFVVKLKAGEAGEFKISRDGQTLYQKDEENSLPSMKKLVPELQKFASSFPASGSGRCC
jgi:predicted Rdx family selenoprotein